MGETLSTVMKIAIAAVIIVGLGAIGKTVYEKFKGGANQAVEYEVE